MINYYNNLISVNPTQRPLVARWRGRVAGSRASRLSAPTYLICPDWFLSDASLCVSLWLYRPPFAAPGPRAVQNRQRD